MYRLPDDRILIPVQRGDSILAKGKSPRLRFWDSMISPPIDNHDPGWTERITVSDFNMSENAFLSIPRSEKERILPATQPGNGLRSRTILDWSAITPLVLQQAPNYFAFLREPKTLLPIVELDHIPDCSLQCSSRLNLHRELIPDVGQITSGSYTIGPSGADYLVYGGGSGFAAAVGNLTGNIDGSLIGNIAETGTAKYIIALGGYDLTTDNTSSHSGDPTAGYLVVINHSSYWQSFEQEGDGNVYVEGFRTRRDIATGGPSLGQIWVTTIGGSPDQTIYIRNNMLDNNNLQGVGISIGDNTPIVYIYNNAIWECGSGGGSLGTNVGILQTQNHTSNLTVNNSIYNCNYGIDCNGTNFTCRNNAVLDCVNGDYARTSGATGRYNRDVDGTGADVNWNSATGNASTTSAAAWQSVTDTDSTFLDLVGSGPLDATGEDDGLAARTIGIRGRDANNCIGAAETASGTIPLFYYYYNMLRQ